ncbi:MAG: saccharopine dehydrogenase [Bacteroidetes bacterium]|nr:MAG: saccharopine dehydrogenase [Bacteroidota bacterium]
MKRILILGAGRSSTVLIHCLREACAKHGWHLTVADISEEMVRAKTGPDTAHLKALAFDVHNSDQRAELIQEADVVISMLPASFHPLVAGSCLHFGKHLLTASYLPDEIRQMDAEARRKGILMLMEAGLDPGIDHMSAMRVLDKIRAQGYTLTGFETFTGGLIAPETAADNPWRYKFTWNPRNVVLAGSGHVKFIQEGRYKFIPYHRLFRRTEIIYIPEHGYFEGYANRDSLKYLDVYNLRGIRTLYRGTLRRPGFCRAWDIFVQLGATDDSYQLEGVGEMTHRQFINSFLSYDPHNSVELKLAHYLGLDLEGEEMHKLQWLGLFEETPIGLETGSPAQILEHILKKRWSLQPDDQDMIVMWHKFDFLDGNRPRQIQSHMVIKGEDASESAMAKTVGLPIAIAARQLLTGQITATGVHIPVTPELYGPLLDELKGHGIDFVEREVELTPTH